jgi:hypothetical protein
MGILKFEHIQGFQYFSSVPVVLHYLVLHFLAKFEQFS